jgi:hypothetical protein
MFIENEKLLLCVTPLVKEDNTKRATLNIVDNIRQTMISSYTLGGKGMLKNRKTAITLGTCTLALMTSFVACGKNESPPAKAATVMEPSSSPNDPTAPNGPKAPPKPKENEPPHPFSFEALNALTKDQREALAKDPIKFLTGNFEYHPQSSPEQIRKVSIQPNQAFSMEYPISSGICKITGRILGFENEGYVESSGGFYYYGQFLTSITGSESRDEEGRVCPQDGESITMNYRSPLPFDGSSLNAFEFRFKTAYQSATGWAGSGVVVYGKRVGTE